MNQEIKKDYGADPIGDDKFRMVPSGAIVGREEKDLRLAHTRRHAQNDCLGLSWQQIGHMQGSPVTTK